jgi:hypothetical protein
LVDPVRRSDPPCFDDVHAVALNLAALLVITVVVLNTARVMATIALQSRGLV